MKKLGALFLLVIAVSSLAITLSGPTLVSANTESQETARRSLLYLYECLNKRIIDEDDDISDFGDLFDNNEDSRGVIVTGLDRDSSDGVQSCTTVMLAGWRVYKNDSSITEAEFKKQLIEELTGESYEGSTLSNDKVDANRSSLRGKINERLGSLGTPSRAQRNERFATLLDACYNFTNAVDPNRPINDDKDIRYSQAGSTIYGYFKADDEDDFEQSVEFNKEGGQDGLGDLELDKMGDDDVNDEEALTFDWYPVGVDALGLDWLANEGEGGDSEYDVNISGNNTGGPDTDIERRAMNAIVDCSFVKRHQQLLFGDGSNGFWKLNAAGNELVLVGDDGETTTLEQASNTISPDESDPGQSCESLGGAMSWIMCPIINLLDAGLIFVDNQITRLLDVDEDRYTASGIEDMWRVMRNISYIILVPIVLVMVISTALGFEFVSAYTVKRALPRLIAATIFIALSWSIVTFLVGMSNNVGSGVLGLMEAPIKSGLDEACQDEITLSCYFGVDTNSAPDAILHGILFIPQAAGTVIGLIIFIILYGATLLTSIVIGFLVLLARQMFIIGLMALAPLAILAWIFPGNDKLWQWWWSLFTKLLIMFPLIMGLIGTGRLFAAVLNGPPRQGGLDGAVLSPLMVLAAYILPYALIPLTFKFAGSFFGTIAGFAQDRSRGIFDRQRAKRQQRWGEFKSTGELPGFRGSNPFARGMKRIGTGVGAGYKGRYGFGERGQQAIGGNIQVAGDQALKDNPNLQKILIAQDDTSAIMSLSGGTTSGGKLAAQKLRDHWYQSSKADLDQKLASGQIGQDEYNTQLRAAAEKADSRRDRAFASASALGFTRGNAAAALTVMAQNKSRSIGVGRHDLIRDGINRLSGGNTQLAQDLAYNYEYNSRQAGRMDLGGDWTSDTVRGFEAQAKAAEDAGDLVAAEGFKAQARRATFLDGVARTGTTDLVRGHSATTKQAAEVIRADMASGDLERQAQSASLALELQNSLTYATGENKAVINQLMDDLGIDTTGAAGGIDKQLADKITQGAGLPPGGGVGGVSAEELRNRSRVFSGGSEQRGSPNDPNNPQQQQPPQNPQNP